MFSSENVIACLHQGRQSRGRGRSPRIMLSVLKDASQSIKVLLETKMLPKTAAHNELSMRSGCCRYPC